MATEPRPLSETATAEPKPAAAKGPLAGRREADKKKLAEEREQRAKEHAEREKKRGTPTPTQEEIDMVKMGHPVELANDGSGPDPNEATNTVKHIGGKPPGEYATRQMAAKT
jgi:hypothetical protein